MPPRRYSDTADEYICSLCERGQHSRCRDELCECCSASPAA